jgi:hypothetical protein
MGQSSRRAKGEPTDDTRQASGEQLPRQVRVNFARFALAKFAKFAKFALAKFAKFALAISQGAS